MNSVAANVNTHTAKSVKSVHVQTVWVFTMVRRRCSRSSGMSVHVAAEYAASTADPKRSHRWYNTVGGFLPISWFVPRNLRRANKEILPLKKQLKAMRPLWQNIKVPTTIIQGGKDKLVNPKNADYIQNALVNAKVNMVALPEANHFIHWENPQLLVDALATFVPQANRTKQEADVQESKK